MKVLNFMLGNRQATQTPQVSELKEVECMTVYISPMISTTHGFHLNVTYRYNDKDGYSNTITEGTFAMPELVEGENYASLLQEILRKVELTTPEIKAEKSQVYFVVSYREDAPLTPEWRACNLEYLEYKQKYEEEQAFEAALGAVFDELAIINPHFEESITNISYTKYDGGFYEETGATEDPGYDIRLESNVEKIDAIIRGDCCPELYCA